MVKGGINKTIKPDDSKIMEMDNNPIVEVRGVHKSFKDIKAVKGVKLTINRGEFLALLGPNGAGKTTLVEMIEGIQQPDSGEIFIDNKQWKNHQHELHQIIGISLQETRFMEKLTTFETLQLFASFYKLNSERVKEVIQLIGLEEKQKAYVNNLSGGQRQRLALGVALLNQPQLLLLDEPTTGLDPNARREIWQILLHLKKEYNTSLILTTHYMEEAEFLCDRIIIMNQGVILSQGSLQEILEQNGGNRNLDELFINMTGRHLYE
jgi:ABC-2 type transport system ATP-binding protein